MADGMCDWDSGTPHARNHILTTLSPPATVELCNEHYGPGLIPLLASEIGVDPGDFYANVERFIAREVEKADRALADAQAAEAAEGGEDPIPGSMGTGQVADDDTETLILADEGEYAGGDGAA